MILKMLVGPTHKKSPSICTASGKRKIRYRSMKDAKKARTVRQEHDSGYLRVYKCPDCRGYHLTSQRLR